MSFLARKNGTPWREHFLTLKRSVPRVRSAKDTQCQECFSRGKEGQSREQWKPLQLERLCLFELRNALYSLIPASYKNTVLIQAGETVDVETLIQPGHHEIIIDALQQVGSKLLKPVKEFLGDEYSYGDYYTCTGRYTPFPNNIGLRNTVKRCISSWYPLSFSARISGGVTS